MTVRQAGPLNQNAKPHHTKDGTSGLQVSFPPGHYCSEKETGLKFYERRVKDVLHAWGIALTKYAPKAIWARTGKDFAEVMKSILPGLKLALEVYVASVGVFALIGAIAGSLAGGAGAVPGAIAGAKLGSLIGLILLEWMGLAFLVAYVLENFHDARVLFQQGFATAWDSCGDPARIDLAARQIAAGVGVFSSLVLQGIIAYAAKEGTPAALARLRNSRYGVALASWLQRNQILVEVEKLLAKLEIGRKASPLVRSRLRLALEFLKKRKFSRYKDDWLKGVDFHKEVKVAALEPGTQIIQYQDLNKKIKVVVKGAEVEVPLQDLLQGKVKPDSPPQKPLSAGNFFARPGAGMQKLGIDSTGRTFFRYKVLHRIEVLESTASGINANFTGAGPRIMAGGGEVQYLIPDDALPSLELIYWHGK